MTQGIADGVLAPAYTRILIFFGALCITCIACIIKERPVKWALLPQMMGLLDHLHHHLHHLHFCPKMPQRIICIICIICTALEAEVFIVLIPPH